jgi:ATP/maltotriose-dependent transcriptional regulator MalT
MTEKGMTKAGMGDLDSAVLRAATQLSVLSGRMVRLLEHLNQLLSTEHEPISTNAEPNSTLHAELLSARELQKQLVAGHFALVRSLLRKQRRQWMMTVADTGEVGIRQNEKRPFKSRAVETRESDGQSFTERQREIIQLVALGYDNRQIGQSLCLAEQTVKNHLHAIFEKTGVSKRSDLAIRAYNGEDADPKSLVSRDFPTTSAHADRVKARAAGD